MENTANLGLFAGPKIVSEYEERIYGYMEKTPKRHKTVNISFNNNMNFNWFQILFST